MARGIETEEVQEKHVFVFAEGCVEGAICGGVFEEL